MIAFYYPDLHVIHGYLQFRGLPYLICRVFFLVHMCWASVCLHHVSSYLPVNLCHFVYRRSFPEPSYPSFQVVRRLLCHRMLPCLHILPSPTMCAIITVTYSIIMNDVSPADGGVGCSMRKLRKIMLVPSGQVSFEYHLFFVFDSSLLWIRCLLASVEIVRLHICLLTPKNSIGLERDWGLVHVFCLELFPSRCLWLVSGQGDGDYVKMQNDMFWWFLLEVLCGMSLR